MDRGFLSGLAAGLVLVVGGGIVVSELAPPPVLPVDVDLGVVAPGATAPDAAAKAAADPVVAEPSVPTAEPAPPLTPAATPEPMAPTAAKPTATVTAAAPATPAAPATDKLQPPPTAPEKAPQTVVTDAGAALASTAVVVETALPLAGAMVESPKPMLPGTVALPASDGPALTPKPAARPVATEVTGLATATSAPDLAPPAAVPAELAVSIGAAAIEPAQPITDAVSGSLADSAPAAKPAAAPETGDAPATKAPDLATTAAALAEPAASIGAAATEPAAPGADPAPANFADPAPLPADPAAEPAEIAKAEIAKVGVGVAEATPDLIPAEEAQPGILALTDSGMPSGANAPKPGFATDAPGVRIIRPTTTKPLPAARADAVTADDAADEAPALVRNGADFANPEGKPLMAIILIDDGSQNPAIITGLGFPVTVALDPTRPGAAEAAAIYRAAGLEVLILATALPAGATASDLEVTFQSHFNALPQAVGVMDLPLDGFQDNRMLAQQIIGILGLGGYGLVTIDKGLNPAAQVAERERLAQARVFRELDAAGETTATIRRTLDRAAFRGAQQGSVVVLGHGTGETLQALVEWAAEGRAANMALSPVSAVMSGV